MLSSVLSSLAARGVPLRGLAWLRLLVYKWRAGFKIPLLAQTHLWLAHGAMLVCAVTFASIPTVNKFAMQEGVPFLEVAQWRIVLSSVVCILYECMFGHLKYNGFSLAHVKVSWLEACIHSIKTAIPWQDRLRMMLLGAMGVALLQYFLSWGLSMTTGIHGLLIMTTVPLITMFLGWCRGSEALSYKRVLGMMLGFAGVAYLLLSKVSPAPSHGVSPTGMQWIWGDALIICNALMYANYLTHSKRYTATYPAMTVTMYNYLGVFLVLLLKSLCQDVGHLLLPLPSLGNMWHSVSHTYSPFAIGCVVWMAVMGSVVAYVCQNKALQVLSASSVASYAFIQPLLGATIAWFWLGESLTPSLGISCLLILIGLYFAQQKAA
jgi:drug/metabolite transporter (DMT)-like permease